MVNDSDEPDWFELLKENLDLPEEEIKIEVEEKMEEFDGLVGKQSASVLVGRDHGLDLSKQYRRQRDFGLDVQNLVAGMHSVDIQVKIRGVKQVKEFDSGRVKNLVVGDDSGNTQVAFWDERVSDAEGLDVGDVIFIQGGYTKDEMSDWQKDRFGVPCINIGDNTVVSKITDSNSSNGKKLTLVFN